MKRKYSKCSCFLFLLTTVIAGFSISSCDTSEQDTLFEKMDAGYTGVSFQNSLKFHQDFNIYRYRNFYNGGGVALGDLNNDGLIDIYLTGNQVENKLYLNRGDFKFEDITESAGVAGERSWSTGVSMADVNGDGWLDIYVCNSGIVKGDDRKNELFINNQDGTFTEKAAKYGIDDGSLSIHGTFFDYDKDGDLDLYLVNNSYRAIGSFDLKNNVRHIRNDEGGDKLYRNELISSGTDYDGGIPFTDVSEEAGIFGSEIGFGLGASIGDLNRDGWPDLYISNDFFERDYLYINNGDGTFDESLEEQVSSISAASMGADIADINYDGYPEIFVTDMLPADEKRLKSITTFDDWEGYREYIDFDYFHQFTRNTFQLNRGLKPVSGSSSSPAIYFSEIGRYSGVEATDWSWGALIADFDLDGVRDLFVANGIYQDLTNLDYLKEISTDEMVRKIVKGDNVDFNELIKMIPSNPIPNVMFSGGKNLLFADSTHNWGLAQPGFSNGSAYGDLDNDGDLDLVINNVNMEAFIYRNRAVQKDSALGWIQIELVGDSANKYGVGVQITGWADGLQWYAEQQPVRGYQSTVDHRVHIGLGNVSLLDSLIVRWPDGSVNKIFDLRVNRKITVSKDNESDFNGLGSPPERVKSDAHPNLQKISADDLGITWRHDENEWNEFKRYSGIYHMRSTEGPAVCTGDANTDGREDIYLGGARDQPGELFLQNADGRYVYKRNPAFEDGAIHEDTECLFLDVNGDNAADLYIGSGSSEFPSNSRALKDRLYVNDGNGNYSLSADELVPLETGFYPTGALAAADFDKDGHEDLFVGHRLKPFAYGVPVDGYLLKGDEIGNLVDITDRVAPELKEVGMITDATWVDHDNDGDVDLWIVGEWMPITLFENRQDSLILSIKSAGLDSTHGWWNRIEFADLDGDGDQDFIAGNLGLNSRFTAGKNEPLHLWTGDFDQNGTVEQFIARTSPEGVYPVSLRHDLVEQVPSLNSVARNYDEYSGKTVYQLFSEEQLSGAIHREVYVLESVVGWNNGDGSFHITPLPAELQFSPVYGILPITFPGDEHISVLTGGNLHAVKPQAGRYDASYGSLLRYSGGSNLQTIPAAVSGWFVPGETRVIKTLENKSGMIILVGKNDDSPALFRISNSN